MHRSRFLMTTVLLLLAGFAGTAAAQQADGTLLSITAQAEASRVPDVATLSAGVVTQSADAGR